MIQFEEVSYEIGGRAIIDRASLLVAEGARVGIIGANGAGKTTVLRLIAGEIEPTRGSVHRPRHRSFGFLRQRPQFRETDLVLRYVLEGDERFHIEREMRQAEGELGRETDPGRIERAVRRLEALRHRFAARSGPKLQGDAEAILAALGIPREDFSRPAGSLSGGEASRVALARVLLQDPDVLLLDEPTNFLDLRMVEWLEEYLRRLPRTLVIVSHDRYLLNRVVDGIIEVEMGSTMSCRGGFDDYRREKERRLEAQAKAHRVQQEQIRRTEEFIRRNIAGQKHRQAKSRRRMLERMEVVEAPRSPDPAGPVIRFDLSGRGGDAVLVARELSLSFGDRVLFRGLDLRLERGEKVALIGANGTGKSSLLGVLAGRIAPTEGSVEVGPRTRIGYFDQDQADLGDDRTVLAEVREVVPRWTDQEIRDLLGRFLFQGDAVLTPVRDLSGGERVKLALVKTIVGGASLLLLDEPTSSLDVYSRQALGAGLADFPGTVLMVSHDRYLVDEIADRILVTGVGDEGIRGFIGNYSEYARTAGRQADRGARRERRPRRRKARPRDRDRSRELQAIEERIADAERELGECQASSADASVYMSPERMRALKQRMKELEGEIAGLYERWAAAAGE